MRPQLDPCTLAGFEQVEELAHARTKYHKQNCESPEKWKQHLAEFVITHDRLQAEYRKQTASQQPADQAQK